MLISGHYPIGLSFVAPPWRHQLTSRNARTKKGAATLSGRGAETLTSTLSGTS